MTTIVYKDGVLAADSRAWGGDRSCIGTKHKIHRIKGWMIGCSASVVGMPDRFMRIFERDKISLCMEEDWSIEVIAISPEGHVYRFNSGRNFTGPLDAPYHALGSGDKYALGALAMGASAVRAVEVGIEHDYCSGYPIRELYFTPIQPKKKKKKK